MKPMRTSVISIGLMGLAATLAGCTAPPREGEPVRQTIQSAQPGSAEELMDSAAEVLRRNNFRIDVIDRRSGVVRTLPETSQHFVEFWRHDVDTAYDFMEASLRPVRRTATVTISTNGVAGPTDVTIEVVRETFSTPERQFNSSIAAFRMFGDVLPAVQTGRRITAADEYWIPSGRDLAMERYLLAKIMTAAGTRPTESPAQPEVESGG
jgi:hypothetical protein